MFRTMYSHHRPLTGRILILSAALALATGLAGAATAHASGPSLSAPSRIVIPRPHKTGTVTLNYDTGSTATSLQLSLDEGSGPVPLTSVTGHGSLQETVTIGEPNTFTLSGPNSNLALASASVQVLSEPELPTNTNTNNALQAVPSRVVIGRPHTTGTVTLNYDTRSQGNSLQLSLDEGSGPVPLTLVSGHGSLQEQVTIGEPNTFTLSDPISNNVVASVSVQVLSEPELPIDNDADYLQVEQIDPNELQIEALDADLAVQSDGLDPGNMARFRVSNIGRANAGPFRVEVHIPGHAQYSVDLIGMGAGDLKEESLPEYACAGRVGYQGPVRIVVDPDHAVSDSNRQNNETTFVPHCAASL